jgi:diadenosine tetraphosphate (Ap4A) HIT family hydrolase
MKTQHTCLDDAISSGDAPWTECVSKDFHVHTFLDKYPVTQGHLLFVPVYNTDEVLKDCFYDALKHGKRLIEQGDCDGFNIGVNWGETAGQTINYPHIHLIPRRKGDMQDPTGGVRHVIPEKGNYRKKI